MYQRGKLIEAITVNIFVENAQENNVTALDKWRQIRWLITTDDIADFLLVGGGFWEEFQNTYQKRGRAATFD